MAEDATYQTKVYHERGGGAEVVKSGGIIRGHSGGIMSMESEFVFTLASQDILTKDMARVVHSRNETVTYDAGAGATEYDPSYIDSNVRVMTVIGSATVAAGSVYLGPCSAGAELFLRLVGDIVGGWGNDQTDVTVHLSGCILLGSLGSALTSMTLYTSGASDALVHFIAPTNNVWSIIHTNGDSIAEH